MKTQKQISSMIIRLSQTASKLEYQKSKAQLKEDYNKIDKIDFAIRANYRLIKKYCSEISKEGFEDNPRLGETLCCDFEEFSNAYLK